MNAIENYFSKGFRRKMEEMPVDRTADWTSLGHSSVFQFWKNKCVPVQVDRRPLMLVGQEEMILIF